MQARTLLLAALGLSLTCLGQTSETAKKSSADPQTSEAETLPLTPLDILSTTEVPGTPEPYVIAPFCASSNSVIVQVATSAGIGDILRISSDGKEVTRFSTAKVTDLTQPTFGPFFVADSGLYILATSKMPQSDTVRLKTPSGEIVTQPRYAAEGSYIIHFRFDGTYAGAVGLDVPFKPLQIGAFPSGGFLAAGRTNDKSHAPVVALIKPDGRLDRFLTMEGDIHAAKKDIPASEDVGGLPISGANYDETLLGAEGASTIVADGRSLLLVRSGQRVPIFSISSGGEVKAVMPQAPPGFTLLDLRAARDKWVALYTRPMTDDPKNASIVLETYALNPETGKALARYGYPSFLGVGLACTNGFDFTLLERGEKNLQVVRLVPSRRASSGK